MSYYLGPDVGRWTPATWADVVRAAGSGILDETHWVELKLAVPPTSTNANLELARDLAALALDGGLLIIGIADDDHAGAVEGTDLDGLADRIEQVARNRVDPPLNVRTVEILHPDEPGRGCLLVVVPASADAPHMVDQNYWGRSERGKRKLADPEVRRHILGNERARGSFDDLFVERRSAFPIRGDGVLYLLVQPRSRRASAAATQVSDPRALLGLSMAGMPSGARQWPLAGELPRHQRVRRGVRLSNLNADELVARAADQDAGLLPVGEHFPVVAMQFHDDGAVEYARSKLVADRPGPDATGLRASTQGIVWLTFQALTAAARFGEQVGYGGMYDVGLHIGGLRGSLAAPDATSWMVGLHGPGYPDACYEEVVAVTADQLADARSLAEKVLRPCLALLGVEHQLDQLIPA